MLLVLTSSPHSPAGERALELAESLADQGHALTLCCLQDAVCLAASERARPRLRRLMGSGVRCVVLEDDLKMRGLRAFEETSVVDRKAVVSLLADHDRVVGAL